MAHRVTAAYVTLRVPNELGQEVLLGFYEGAVLPASVNREDLDRQVRKGMVAKIAEPEIAAPVEPEPAVRPAGNGSREDWASYAASLGAPGAETAPVDQGGLSRDDLRAKYGN